MNWFDYKKDKEFILTSFNNREGEEWPPSLRDEIPERPIKRMFCKHSKLLSLLIIYFEPDDKYSIPPTATDTLIMKYFNILICSSCGDIFRREQIGESQKLPTTS